MLRSLSLTNFKSFGQQTVQLAPFTVLVGANGSGKSNFFDAVRFLKGLALDFTVSDTLRGRWEGGREIWQGIRGGPAEIARRPDQEVRLEAHWQTEWT